MNTSLSECRATGTSPRVRGKLDHGEDLFRSHGYTSPRVRGKRGPWVILGALKRYIPACAGETRLVVGLLPLVPVHPRVCGGNRGKVLFRGVGQGTPRVRGKHHGPRRAFRHERYIPACAGETRWPRSSPRHRSVHPRVCGGNPWLLTDSRSGKGTSPRVRGKLGDTIRIDVRQGYIPACAGETATL